MANRNSMGLSAMENENSVVFKRKFRWTVLINAPCGNSGFDIGPEYAYKTARPKIAVGEKEINFLHGKRYLPGRIVWEEWACTFYDATTPSIGKLISWMKTIYDFSSSDVLMSSSGYQGTGNLYLYDGCGQQLEEWTLSGLWPKSLDFGDLDYSSEDQCDIVASFRYNRANYTPGCGGSNVVNCGCKGCGSSAGVSGGDGGRASRGSPTPTTSGINASDLGDNPAA